MASLTHSLDFSSSVISCVFLQLVVTVVSHPYNLPLLASPQATPGSFQLSTEHILAHLLPSFIFAGFLLPIAENPNSHLDVPSALRALPSSSFRRPPSSLPSKAGAHFSAACTPGPQSITTISRCHTQAMSCVLGFSPSTPDLVAVGGLLRINVTKILKNQNSWLPWVRMPERQICCVNLRPVPWVLVSARAC